MSNKITWVGLKQRQSLSLENKIVLTKRAIEIWYDYWKGEVYVAFSGGKDSTVLLHIVRSMYPEVPAVFCDTGLEYPEIREFVKTVDNVVWLKPKMPFTKVIEKYGYPVISKEVAQKVYDIRHTKSAVVRNSRLHGDYKGNGKLSEKWKYLVDAPFKISRQCCYVMKKGPAYVYERESGRKAFFGVMATESRLRKNVYLAHGCNVFHSKRPLSSPIAFWLDANIWEYIKKYGVAYSNIYNMGWDRTGCMFCMFGVHREKEPNRFQRMKETHPKLYDYCINDLNLKQCLDYIGVKYEL